MRYAPKSGATTEPPCAATCAAVTSAMHPMPSVGTASPRSTRILLTTGRGTARRTSEDGGTVVECADCASWYSDEAPFPTEHTFPTEIEDVYHALEFDIVPVHWEEAVDGRSLGF